MKRASEAAIRSLSSPSLCRELARRRAWQAQTEFESARSLSQAPSDRGPRCQLLNKLCAAVPPAPGGPGRVASHGSIYTCPGASGGPQATGTVMVQVEIPSRTLVRMSQQRAGFLTQNSSQAAG